MKTKQYLVDLPDINAKNDDDSCYINCGQFDTNEAALNWLETMHGMPKRIAQFFITEVAL